MARLFFFLSDVVPRASCGMPQPNSSCPLTERVSDCREFRMFGLQELVIARRTLLGGGHRK